MKSLNMNHVADNNLGFLLLFNPLFICLLDVKSVKKSANNLLIIGAG